MITEHYVIFHITLTKHVKLKSFHFKMHEELRVQTLVMDGQDKINTSSQNGGDET